MQVILLDNITNLGKLGDQIDVKDGYARNFLIPQGKAVLATKKNIEYFKGRQADFEAKLAEVFASANVRAERIASLKSINIVSRAGEGGKLYGSINARDIANAVTAAGIEVDKREVRLPNGVLRTIGEHKVGFHIYGKVFVKLMINVVAK